MKRDKTHENRVKKMVLGTGLFAVLLVAATYAWFIGMNAVSVEAFEVEIAAIDGLALSINGANFGEKVIINGTNYNTAAYTGNTNTWTKLIPMSTVGEIDDTASRLVLYEKGSLTTTPGGYRLMASRVNNYPATAGDEIPQGNGYVAFDLFIQNLSGKAYYTENNVLNEEAIYLTTDSEVTVGSAGTNGTGIENSVRVAFAQIGRVNATTLTEDDGVETITGINCGSTGAVTTICSSRKAQIWEPNDTKHVQNAINWYDTACQKRNAADYTATTSYGGDCTAIANGDSLPTYAVSGVINYTDKIDIYDGTRYNGYGTSISNEPAKGKLMEVDYFTDTEKMYTSTARPEFMTLAPNSITKVRVYVYIEGQDIDNYDFASLGQAISVTFGFTKERFTDKDVNYDPTGTATLPDDVLASPSDEAGE